MSLLALRALLPARASAVCRSLCSATAAASPAPSTASRTGGSGEKPADTVGPLAQGHRMVVQAPAGGGLADPAAPDAPLPLLQRASEAVQDLLLRPLPETRGRAYHYAEDSARAVVAEQEAQGRDLPGVESMYAPAEEVGDAITAPRNWHFSNRTEEEAPEWAKEGSRKGKPAGEAAGHT
ncbi:hypothetical protein ABPG75_014084 [Micractinium tetrahymenae]